MKRLYDTHLFKLTDKKINFIENVKKINLDKDRVPPSQLDDDLKVISRRFSFSLKQKVIDYLNANKIIMIYPTPGTLTKLIPIYLTTYKSDVAAVVDIGLYATKDRMGNINIEKRKLYALLELALIERELYVQNNKFSMSGKIYSTSARMYTKLMNKVLDKLYAVNLDTMHSDQLNFMLGKFFMSYIFEKADAEIINNVAYSCIFNDTPKSSILQFDKEIDPMAYTSLPNFFAEIQQNFNEITDMTVRNFINHYMTMYGDTAVFSIECFNSLLEVCLFGGYFGCRIVKDQVFDMVVGTEANDVHIEICRLLA